MLNRLKNNNTAFKKQAIGTLALCCLHFGSPFALGADAEIHTRELLDFSLEDLAQITISSVAKKPQKLSEAAASVFVITAEDIRRSGATSLPEALRLAPNLQVARIDANSYAISARGFNSTTTNKLQVLIDGRIAYSPLYSGVFWDVQDILLPDVERIEVISGSNATTWGSNAVNGVINVITRSAADTQGNLLVAGGGNLEQQAAFRHGGTLAEGASYRVYGKTLRIDDSQLESGGQNIDAWKKIQLGFRADDLSQGRLTLQGDIYAGRRNSALYSGDDSTRGLNLLARWDQRLENDSQLQLQAYYDRTERDLAGTLDQSLNILQMSVQQTLGMGTGQEIIWGIGHRSAWDDVKDQSAVLTFLPAEKYLRWNHAFLQDEITLRPDLKLTLGARLEHNSYTGLEFMPNVRLAWNLSPQDLLWLSVAHGERTPSRVDRDFYLDVPGIKLDGGPDFESESANTLEIGYRGNRLNRLNYSITAFYARYDELRTVDPTGSGTYEIGNGMEATTYGIEAWADYQAAPRWRLSAGTLLQHESFHFKPGISPNPWSSTEANNPSHQWMLRSSLDLSEGHQLDMTLRHVGKLSNLDLPAYTTADLRYGWKPHSDLELSLRALNLFDPQHPEFGTAASRSEVERSLFLEMLWRY
uniref:TonB-dependent receptor plug domain-containing protein n=1 Tax=Marinobacterium profundum TaxID=1714300 RepID=UPI0008342AD8|nr:TonB-dependent receptor [Marinobacterium profundum]